MGVRSVISRRFNMDIPILKGRLRRLVRSRQFADDVTNYELMYQDNLNSPSVYQAGKFWARLNRYHRDLIYGGGLDNLRNQYFNRIFAGPEPESRQVYRSLLYIYYKALKELDVDGFLETESEPSIGGSLDQEIFEGHAVSLDFLQSVEEAYLLRQAWAMAGKKGHPRLIVELGAGYGRLAYVCRKMMPECTYVILDLPEALTCSTSYLSRALPGEVVSYSNSRVCNNFSREKLLGKKVWTLGSHQIEMISGSAIDAFVSIYSFDEMPWSAITNYVSHLDRITKGVFYSKQKILEQNIYDDIKVGRNDYPVREHWRLLFSKTSTLYDNFFEYAYAVNQGD